MAAANPQFAFFKQIICPKEANGGKCTNLRCLFQHKNEVLSPSVPSHSLDGAGDAPPPPLVADADSPGFDRPTKRQKTGNDGEVSMLRGSELTGNAVPDSQAQTQGQQSTQVLDSLNNGDGTKASDVYDPSSPQAATRGSGIHTPVSSLPLARKVPSHRQLSSEAQTSAPTNSHTTSSATPSSSAAAKTERKSNAIYTEVALKNIPASSPASTIGSIPAAASLPATPASQVKASAQKPKPARKPESLNPRLIRSAPAGHEVRYKLVKLLHAEYARLNEALKTLSGKEGDASKGLILSDQELIWMALDHEQHVATQKAPIYSNIMKQDVVRYKRMITDKWIKERQAAVQKEEPPRMGWTREKPPINGPPVTIDTGLTPDQEVQILKQLITPITDLSSYGYIPVPPSDEDIANAKEAVEMSQGWEVCDRCSARFQIFPGRNNTDPDLLGELASGGKCTHHPGRAYSRRRAPGDTSHIPKLYRCCLNEVGESPGCVVGNNHVFKVTDPKRMAAVWKFAATPANAHPIAGQNRAVCFDCEMGYTVNGMELIRLTATSWPDGAELVDVLVQPFGEVIDLNSRYSGVWPEDLVNAVDWTPDGRKPPEPEPGKRRILQKVHSPEVARDLLFSLVAPETPLIGHGLENDLNAMRVVHPAVVDTVLLYPHARGLPMRMGLKTLASSQLNKLIQVDDGLGHDSGEDARAAGELVRLRVQKVWQKMQAGGWKVVDGVIKPPGGKPGMGQEKGMLTEEFLEGVAASGERVGSDGAA